MCYHPKLCVTWCFCWIIVRQKLAQHAQISSDIIHVTPVWINSFLWFKELLPCSTVLLFKLCRAAPAFKLISLLYTVLIYENFIMIYFQESAFSNIHVHSHITAASSKTKISLFDWSRWRVWRFKYPHQSYFTVPCVIVHTVWEMETSLFCSRGIAENV